MPKPLPPPETVSLQRSQSPDVAAESARTVLILVNPKSGSSNRRHLVDQLAEQLRRMHHEVRTETDVDRLAHAASQLLANEQLRCVVAAGGDGTITLLANRLPADVPLAVLPLGTANLLARFLTVDSDPFRAAQMIDGGRMVRFDAGLANGQLFLVVASVGFDAEVVQRLHRQRTGNITYGTYIGPLLRTIWKYRFPKFRLQIDGGSPIEGARWAFALNVPRYAMGLRLTPDARPDDGRLDLCTFDGGGFWNGLRYFFSTLQGRHVGLKSSHLQPFQRLTIESDDPVHYELDGDPGGTLPLTIETLPRRVRLVVPTAFDLSGSTPQTDRIVE